MSREGARERQTDKGRDREGKTERQTRTERETKNCFKNHTSIFFLSSKALIKGESQTSTCSITTKCIRNPLPPSLSMYMHLYLDFCGTLQIFGV